MDTEEAQVKESIETQTLPSWQAVGIGVLTGLLFMVSFFVYMLFWNSADRLFIPSWYSVGEAMFLAVYLLWPAILFGIAGALACKFWKKTRLASWIGGLLGALPVTILLVYLAFHSCYAGC